MQHKRSGKYPNRREILGALGALAVGIAFGGKERSAMAEEPIRLYAFLPALERTRAIEEALRRALPAIAITVFGRFADFAAAVAAEKPEGALSPSDTLRALGIGPSLLGVASGSPAEPYVMLTKSPNGSLSELAGGIVGVVDIVGRAELPRLVGRMLGLAVQPTVRRVLQIADLLPLLHLDLAPSVVLPERLSQDFQKMSHLNLRVLKPGVALLGRTALGYPTGKANAALELALRRSPASVRTILGVEGWT